MSTFVRTTRDYEFERALPNNGPSPSPIKFSPSYKFVHTNSPFFTNSDQPRFALNHEIIKEMKQKVKNPRFDEHEGEHLLSGKKPNCKTCKDRFKKVEEQWFKSPILGSMHASLFLSTNSMMSRTTKAINREIILNEAESPVGQSQEIIPEDPEQNCLSPKTVRSRNNNSPSPSQRSKSNMQSAL
jgi:hypothetical protein